MPLNLKSQIIRNACVVISAFIASLLAFGIYPALAAANYYVDCSAASNGNGTQSSPWNNLTTVNNHAPFVGGDQILFKRGVTCNGTLWAKGSGASASSFITLGDYGSGALPIINASGYDTGLQLYNQQYWHIQNLEIKNSRRFGVNIAGNNGASPLNHFRLTNLVVHDVNGSVGVGQPGYSNFWLSGLVIITDNPVPAPTTDLMSNRSGQAFNDVVVDNVQAYNTNQWHGIRAGAMDNANNIADSNGMTIRNSTVHDVRGDGIVMSYTTNGLESSNVAYNTGMAYLYGSGAVGQGVWTPNGIWSWMCHTCTVELNESYYPHSYVAGFDGGNFDIDWGSTNTTVQYNYGHESETYCAAFYAFDNQPWAPNGSGTIRYNICANDHRLPNPFHLSEFWVFNTNRTGNVAIYNNTSSWNPNTSDGPILHAEKGASALTVLFKNNLSYLTGPIAKYAIEVVNNPSVTLNNNLYWATGFAANNVWWYWNGAWYGGLSAFQSGTGQEGGSLYADPLLNSPLYHSVGRPTTQFTLQSGSPAINAGTNLGGMGSRDFFGNTIPQGGAYDIGAYESTSGGGGPTNLLSNPGLETGSGSPWSLYGTTIVASNPHSGTYAAKTTGSNNGTWQNKTGLSPNTTYTFRAWLKAGTTSESAYLYAKNFGGAEVHSTTFNSIAYTLVSLTFTTGSANTNAEIGLWRDPGFGSGDIYSDDYELFQNTGPTNLLSNPGLETGSGSPWNLYGTTIVASNPHAGTYAAKTTGSNNGTWQNKTGLSPNTTYTFRAWLKAGTTSESAYLYAKNFGGSEVHSTTFSGTTYTLVSLTFTTGSANTNAEIGLWRDPGFGSGDIYSDDYELFQ